LDSDNENAKEREPDYGVTTYSVVACLNYINFDMRRELFLSVRDLYREQCDV